MSEIQITKQAAEFADANIHIYRQRRYGKKRPYTRDDLARFYTFGAELYLQGFKDVSQLCAVESIGYLAAQALADADRVEE